MVVTLLSAWLLLWFLYPVKYLYSGELDGWYSNPVECLALIILLDQFHRYHYKL